MQTLFHTSARGVSFHTIAHRASLAFAAAVAIYEGGELIRLIKEAQAVDTFTLAAGSASALHTVVGVAIEFGKGFFEHEA